MNYVIEKWSLGDLPEMLKLWNEVVVKGEAFPQEEILDIDSGKAFFENQTYCGICRDMTNIEINGLYILHPNNVGRCGHIANASYTVKANQRGEGIGERLVKHSMHMAKELGFRIIQFNAVVADNLPANKLYQKLGFKKLGYIPGGFKSLTGGYKDINLYYYNLA